MSLMNLPWTTLVDVDSLAAALHSAPASEVDAHAGDTMAIRVVDARFSLADARAGRVQYGAAHLPGAVYADLNLDLSDSDNDDAFDEASDAIDATKQAAGEAMDKAKEVAADAVPAK